MTNFNFTLNFDLDSRGEYNDLYHNSHSTIFAIDLQLQTSCFPNVNQDDVVLSWHLFFKHLTRNGRKSSTWFSTALLFFVDIITICSSEHSHKCSSGTEEWARAALLVPAALYRVAICHKRFTGDWTSFFSSIIFSISFHPSPFYGMSHYGMSRLGTSRTRVSIYKLLLQSHWKCPRFTKRSSIRP